MTNFINEIITKAEEIITIIANSEFTAKFLEFMANLSEEYPIFTQIMMAFLIITLFKSVSRFCRNTCREIKEFIISCTNGSFKVKLKKFFEFPEFNWTPSVTMKPKQMQYPDSNPLDCELITRIK